MPLAVVKGRRQSPSVSGERAEQQGAWACRTESLQVSVARGSGGGGGGGNADGVFLTQALKLASLEAGE
jgi:hypothetical protein